MTAASFSSPSLSLTTSPLILLPSQCHKRKSEESDNSNAEVTSLTANNESGVDLPKNKKLCTLEGRNGGSIASTSQDEDAAALQTAMNLPNLVVTPTSNSSNCNNHRSSSSSNVIPDANNPPKNMDSWLNTFRGWSHAERVFALDQLIDNCDPTQVRHMMHVIEPQFQRDFIFLLPKEVTIIIKKKKKRNHLINISLIAGTLCSFVFGTSRFTSSGANLPTLENSRRR